LSLNYRNINVLKQCIIAISGLFLLGLVINITADEIFITALMTWLPALILVKILQYTRSFVLTVQITAIISIFLLVLFYVVVDDPSFFWGEVIVSLSESLVQNGLTDQANLISNQSVSISKQMTILMIVMTWSLYAIVLILGCAIYNASSLEVFDYGRFSNLNFGRFFAIITAISSLLLFVFDVEWLMNLAYLCFLFFWLQGLSLIHWFHEEGTLPTLGLILTYVMLPFLNVLMIMILAVAGYTDAWFNYRLRMKN
jgi:hypothetical protein|tara:strand:- start:26275 stop:27042 length:768 start_codon:yes stop_codon:yes gene_type:complete